MAMAQMRRWLGRCALVIALWKMAPALAVNEELSSAVHSKGMTHIICIDGGGSKTSLQVLNRRGEVEYFWIGRQPVKEYLDSSGNLVEIGEEGVCALIKRLISQLHIERQSVLLDPQPYAVVAGFAGAGRSGDRKAIRNMFLDMGFASEKLAVLSDAEMGLAAVGKPGAVLIAGTGSVCMGLDAAGIKRAGGLGKVLGDEGSGYAIGREALRKALAEEYGWGEKTSLTPAIRKALQAEELKTFVHPVNRGDLKKDQIAALCPIVFEEASKGDAVADKILTKAAKDLGRLLNLVLSQIGQKCPVYLTGGVWKSPYAKAFINRVEQSKYYQMLDPALRPKLANRSGENLALLAAQRALHED